MPVPGADGMLVAPGRAMTTEVRLAPAAGLAGQRTADVPAAAASAATGGRGFKLFGEDGFTFGDLVDLVNPIQHIPFLGNLYRRATGDLIDPAMRLAGGALFGGPIGAGLAAVALAFKEFTGSDDGVDAAADAGTALTQAPAAPAGEGRGGWMVAATRRYADPIGPELVPDSRVASRHDGDVVRRHGGWLAQVYTVPGGHTPTIDTRG